MQDQAILEFFQNLCNDDVERQIIQHILKRSDPSQVIEDFLKSEKNSSND